MNALPLPDIRKEESEEDRKVAVIHAMMEIIEQVEHIKPDEKNETSCREPKRKREIDPAEIEDPITFIDDLSYSEEKEIKRLARNCAAHATRTRKVTFSEPIDHRVEFAPHPPLNAVERTLEFLRKVGRLLCITEPDEYEEEEEPFLDYKSYGFR